MLKRKISEILREKSVEELSNEALARRISDPSRRTTEACDELCRRAGLTSDEENNDMYFDYDDILFAAAEELGVSLQNSEMGYYRDYFGYSNAELAALIRETPYWIGYACKELCIRADVGDIYDDLDEPDDEVFEAAAELLGMTIMGDGRRKYELLESSEKSLYLVVWDADGEQIVYIHRYYNDDDHKVSDQIKRDLQELKEHNGDNIDQWNGNCNFDQEIECIQSEYDKAKNEGDLYAWVHLIADSYGVYEEIDSIDFCENNEE